ncbi:cytochrome c [Salinisphaera sp. T31B1]|uniref:c-type cytochrome n=1 Tax=Salinisphaera sp. T31B1 TaxID=727963 RepID=UPI003340BBEC
MSRTRGLSAAVVALAGLLSVVCPANAQPPTPSGDSSVDRGQYLATVGNCAGCHTAPGGQPMAGGLHLDSPYGTFITPNITPDADHGIGRWSDDDFWRAMHEGRRPDGSAMYPACPYTSYTHVERADIDALHAYLGQIPPAANDTPDHRLDWPYRYRSLLTVWQWLYFEPGGLADKPQQSPAWNRGRYLVEGLGHCNECHRARGRFGTLQSADDAPGAMIHGWYAPPLADPAQAGLQQWSIKDAAAFLKRGKADHAAMMGPMADVVFDSLQYWSDEDALAAATYLKSLPARDVESPVRLIRLSRDGQRAAMDQGRTLYGKHCADCHGDNGQGGDGAPALAGNRAVTLADPINVANMIRGGGFAPATEGNPQPYGMPPFHGFSDRELAALISYIRGSWGNQASPVTGTNLRR